MPAHYPVPGNNNFVPGHPELQPYNFVPGYPGFVPAPPSSVPQVTPLPAQPPVELTGPGGTVAPGFNPVPASS